MNHPRIILPLAVAGLVLTAAFTTAVLVNAADCSCKTVAIVQPSEVNALFEIAPMSVQKRAKLVLTNPTLMRAEIDALFAVAPKSGL